MQHREAALRLGARADYLHRTSPGCLRPLGHRSKMPPGSTSPELFLFALACFDAAHLTCPTGLRRVTRVPGPQSPSGLGTFRDTPSLPQKGTAVAIANYPPGSWLGSWDNLMRDRLLSNLIPGLWVASTIVATVTWWACLAWGAVQAFF